MSLQDEICMIAPPSRPLALSCDCLHGNIATSCGYYIKIVCDGCDSPC